MNVLFVASECAPFVKTGGLADVIGAVPKALTALGTDVRVMLPAYPALAPQLRNGTVVREIPDLHGGAGKLVAATSDGLNLLLLDAPHLFDRPGNLYLDSTGKDWSDNHLRFGALARVGAMVALDGLDDWTPDVVNVHDWQAGLLPAYLYDDDRNAPPVVMTVHNIAFQGLFSKTVLSELDLNRSLYNSHGIEFFDKIGFLKAGLALADKITTVSPTYANELMSPEYGMGLEGLLQTRRTDLTGILNGIDLDVWNPASDPELVAPYSEHCFERKVENRADVEKRFNLNPNPSAPLFCVISRLTEQKGLDLLIDCLPALVARGAQLALLGSGDAKLERAFREAAVRFAGSVGVVIGYDEALSHVMQGGSDAILIPSRFEPCGLTQLYGLRYGTLPIVGRTGGLADTIIDANEAALATGCATGFQFSPINAHTLDQAIDRACAIFKDAKTWSTMAIRAMRHPVGWDRSALTYLSLYEGLVSD